MDATSGGSSNTRPGRPVLERTAFEVKRVIVG